MSSLITIDSTVIHQDAEGRYSLNDLHRAAGGESKNQPALWLRSAQTQALIDEIGNSTNSQSLPVSSIEGRNGGTFVCKELVYSYAMWISPKFHLHVIQIFDQAVNGKQSEITGATTALKLTPLAVRAARAFGLDKNAAAISANQLVRKLTGVNLLESFDRTHLVAQNQASLWFTPTELGKGRALSGRAMNLLLAEAGLQHKVGEHWAPTDQAEGFYRLFDTGKQHGDGTPITQVKWAENVLNLIQQERVA